MRPLVINGIFWRVVRVPPGDPRLVDRTGTHTVATTDPLTRTVHLSSALVPPLLDRVLLHEVAHAVAMSYGLLETLHGFLPYRYWVPVEEWAAQTVEGYGVESAVLASESIGRPICVRGYCHD